MLIATQEPNSKFASNKSKKIINEINHDEKYQKTCSNINLDIVCHLHTKGTL